MLSGTTTERVQTSGHVNVPKNAPSKSLFYGSTSP